MRAAARHGVPVRCVWLEAPLAEAQRNVIARMLAAHGRLLAPGEMARGGDDPTRLAPRVLLAQARQLEVPEADEGFAAVERVAFARQAAGGGAAGRAVAFELVAAHGPAILEEGEPGPRLVFGWLPDGDAPLVATTAGLSVAAAGGSAVDAAACTHPGGPPICWCRPPLPGLLLAFAQRRGVDPARLTVAGNTTAHRQLAAAAGARFEAR